MKKMTMRTGLVALFAVVALTACGGSAGQPIDPTGTWTVTDTLTEGVCPASASATLTVAGSGNALTMSEGGVQYAMLASWCDSNVCEAQGALNGFIRDVVFNADGTLGGNRSKSTCTAGKCVTDCAYSTAGHR
jgi:ABC-type phosphate transport system substrate-binding protein